MSTGYDKTPNPNPNPIGTKAWHAVGELKFKTYKQYRDIYPEYDFVFFGDNGQA